MQAGMPKVEAGKSDVKSEADEEKIGPIFSRFLILHPRMKHEENRRKRTLLFSKKRY